MSKDWLPRNHKDLYAQAVITRTYILVPANLTRLGFNPETPQGQWFANDFKNAYNPYVAAYNDWVNEATRTKEKTSLLEETEKAFKKDYRKLYNGFLKDSPLVSNQDLINMGLPERSDSKHIHYPPPTTRIVAKVCPTGPGTLEIHYNDQTKKGIAKPFGVHGAELVSRISEVPVTSHDELTSSKFDTHTPFHLTFPDEQRGKTIYFSLRWENSTGEKGPWNEIQSTIIP